MKHLSRSIPVVAAFLILAPVLPGCRTRPAAVIGPVGPAIPEELIHAFVAEGDRQIQPMHLHAWRLAEASYARAYALAPQPEIREKLALARLLRLTREIDEDIPCPTLEEDVAFVCEAAAGTKGPALCDLARSYAAGPDAAQQMKRLDPDLPRVDSPPLDAYLFTLQTRHSGADAQLDEIKKHWSETYRDSPLFLYLNPGLGLSRAVEIDPNFAEAWEFSAEMSFQRTQIKVARNAFSRALALIPDYTRAVNGLANILFFTLEDYPGALKIYEKTLQLDPENSAALFGKGAALHHLGQYEDSSRALDRMLAGDLSRRGRVAADSVRYFQGEGYYYKAYNLHLMHNPEAARKLIDQAGKFLPDAEEIRYLSGLLYFNAGQLDEAKADFQGAARQGKNCYAFHYLGWIELKQGGSAAASQFLTSTTCLQRGLTALQQTMQSAAGLDIEPAERDGLRLRMEMKLVGYRTPPRS